MSERYLQTHAEGDFIEFPELAVIATMVFPEDEVSIKHFINVFTQDALELCSRNFYSAEGSQVRITDLAVDHR